MLTELPSRLACGIFKSRLLLKKIYSSNRKLWILKPLINKYKIDILNTYGQEINCISFAILSFDTYLFLPVFG